MKAKKQKLEEQIINLFLAKQISEAMKDTMLESLALTKNLEGVEAQLNDPTTLKQMTEFGDAFSKKLKKVRGQVLQLDNEKHVMQLLDSLAGKGFLEMDIWSMMIKRINWSSDPSCLTDQEFLLLIDISSCALEQHKEKEKNE